MITYWTVHSGESGGPVVSTEHEGEGGSEEDQPLGQDNRAGEEARADPPKLVELVRFDRSGRCAAHLGGCLEPGYDWLTALPRDCEV